MTNCLLGCLRGLWSFVIGSLRAILLFLCIIFLLIQTIIILTLLGTYGVEATPFDSQIIISIAVNSMLFMLSLLGCYGTLYNHTPSIKLFSLLIGASAILFTVSLALMIKSVWTDEQNFESSLKLIMEKYDWRHTSTDPEVHQVTLFWDLIQSTGCCGYHGPEDWKPYRPIPGVYPGSCCKSNDISGYCISTYYSQGCEKNLEAIVMFVFAFFVLYIGLKSLLCIIACIVGTLNLSPTVQQQVTTHYVYTAPINVQMQNTNPYPPAGDRGSKASLVNSEHIGPYDQPPSYPKLN